MAKVRCPVILTCACGAVLSFYSLVPAAFPGAGLASVLPGRDLSAHALGYGVLALLLCWAAVAGGARRLVAAPAAAALAFSWGAVVELVQSLVPWRAAGAADLLWDAGGTVFAATMCLAGGVALDAWRRLGFSPDGGVRGG